MPWVPADITGNLRKVLREAAPPEIDVHDYVPRKWDRYSKPVVTVHRDGTPVYSGAFTGETVRLNVRANNRELAYKTLIAIESWLIDPATRCPSVGSIEPSVGPIVTTDKDLGCALASASFIIIKKRKSV